MNIGFVNIYPWRPHGFHAGFLEYQCNLLGHSTYFLECGLSFNKCVCSDLNHKTNIIPWIKCKIGRVSKYNNNNVFTMNSKIPKDRLNQKETIKSLLSSVLAYYREEINLDYSSNSKIARSVDLLTPNYLKAYYSTLDLIDKKNLQAIIVFNGRIDVTRAAIDAAKFAKINFITHDRPPMGHGIQINVNQNIIGLKDRAAMNAKFDDKPLTSRQAQLAGAEISKRFLGKNLLEWRINDTTKKVSQWPTLTKHQKILIVPSSIFEKAGHEDWITPWKTATDGYDLFLKSIDVKKDQVVVRFHPQWAQKKGKITGQSSHKHYMTWCKNNSYHYIDSHEKISTLDLIDKCDVLVVNDSTAMVEGGSLGKKIVNLGPSGKDGSRFYESLETKESINSFKGFDDWISKEQIIRKTLRYVYTTLARYPQYFDYVRGLSTTECIAYEGANPERLEDMIKLCKLIPDDEIFGSLDDESEVLDLIGSQSWIRIIELSHKIPVTSKVQLSLTRSFPYGKLDNLRKNLKRGDF
jgi:hypothetical protein